MDSDIFKKSLKISAIFLLTVLILFFAIISGTSKEYIGMRLSIIIPLLFFFLFFSIIFYFLFKYQKDEYHKKSMFLKLPLTAVVMGATAMISLAVYSASTCSGEECMATLFFIYLIPVAAITLSIIALILTINA